MNEIEIKRHSFDLAKNRLKEFSEKTEAEFEIGVVETDGFWIFGKHKVTGEEFNTRLETIQRLFIDVNTINNKVIREFREVYYALDALDKDYITSIVANVKAIEKTSNDVRVQQGILKQHNEKLANQQSKLDAHQAELEKNVANISKIVTTLKVFKEELEKYKHLGDIDVIWSDISKAQRELVNIGTDINNAKAFMKDNSEAIKTLVQFKTRTDKIAHLKDLDKLWDDFQTAGNELLTLKKDVGDICKKAEEQSKAIAVLCDFKDRIDNFKHLDDIDEMWHNVDELRIIAEKTSNELKNLHSSIVTNFDRIDSLVEFKSALERIEHLYDVDELWNKCVDNQLGVARIDEVVKNQQEQIEALTTEFNNNSSNHQQQLDDLSRAIEGEIENRHTEVKNLAIAIDGDIKNQQEQIETLTTDINNDISNHQQQLDDLSAVVTDNMENQQTELGTLKTTLSEMQTVTAEKENTYIKKLRIAYILSSCGIGIAVIAFILLLTRII